MTPIDLLIHYPLIAIACLTIGFLWYGGKMFSGPLVFQCQECKKTELGSVTSVGSKSECRNILPKGWGYCYTLVSTAVQMFIVCSEMCSEALEERINKEAVTTKPALQ